MKKIKNILLSTFITFVFLSANITSVLADTSDPYGPHVPVPTGIEDLDMLVLIGITSYIGGISLISGSKYLKKNVI
jgi:hypothetical protein